MSTAAVPIYQGEDFYVPQFQVRLGGQPVGQDVVRDITQVTYKDDIEQIDTFEITINNLDIEKWSYKYVDKRTYKYSDQDLFDPGKELELWMGYYGPNRLRRLITGEITSLRPTFPASSPSTLAVSGLNLLHRLRTKQESHPYENMTDSEIAQQIGGRLNVMVRTDSTAAAKEERYKYLFQDNQYDIIFLMERARRVGYDLFVEEPAQGDASAQASLYFGPSVDVRNVSYELKYGRDLIEFQPNLTTANQVAQVTVRGWDPVHKTKIEATATRGDIKTQGVGAKGGQPAIDESFNQRQEIVATQPIFTQAEAKTMAVQRLERIAKDMVKASGSTVGLPDLRAGSVVMIAGVGTRFSGRYFVTATTHTIGDGGYTTHFECRREELKGS